MSLHPTQKSTDQKSGPSESPDPDKRSRFHAVPKCMTLWTTNRKLPRRIFSMPLQPAI